MTEVLVVAGTGCIDSLCVVVVVAEPGSFTTVVQDDNASTQTDSTGIKRISFFISR